MLTEVKERTHAKLWVKNAFDEWKLFCGFDTIKSIVDILNKGLIKGLVDMLSSFILQVTKKNGSLYPPTKYILCTSL
jgi:hypothetical protein